MTVPDGQRQHEAGELQQSQPPTPAGDAEVRRRARLLALVFGCAAVVMLPWTAYLAVALPHRELDRHYDLAWVGFDCLLVVAFAATAYFAFRLDPRVELPATVAATLLVVDAWFDVTTSSTRRSAGVALLFAVFLELPTAALALYLARRTNRVLRERAHMAPLPFRRRRGPTSRRDAPQS